MQGPQPAVRQVGNVGQEPGKDQLEGDDEPDEKRHHAPEGSRDRELLHRRVVVGERLDPRILDRDARDRRFAVHFMTCRHLPRLRSSLPRSLGSPVPVVPGR